MSSVKILRVEDLALVAARHAKISDLLQRSTEPSLVEAELELEENGNTFKAKTDKLDGDVPTWDSYAEPNLPPVANADTYDCGKNTQLVVSAPGFLINDTDPNTGDALAVRSVDTIRTLGTVDYWNPDGSFAYTPPAGHTGSDTFTYTSSDGVLDSIPTTVTIITR